MITASIAILLGFALLVWSADKFVDGAAASAGYLGMPPLLIGMVIVGFGTSAPEMVVSAMASIDGKPELALGNALGSNIVNIGLILGITAIIAPIAVQSNIIRKELPLLILIGILAGILLWDGELTRVEAVVLLIGFFGLIGWSIYSALKGKGDTLESETANELKANNMPLKKAVMWLLIGLVLLVVSSRILVWGAVTIAQSLGVSDLIIGLTIVALGTSLPELAASVAAARKGEHDIAIGNVVGSNMFNILAVIGIAGVISPISGIGVEVFARDWAVMMGLTVALVVMCMGFRGPGRINRFEGLLLLIAIVAYNLFLFSTVAG
ncbi:calcium/sodium antiporter [Photobacterium sp. WH24]|uniref:Calcium/sodium antiporter n=1 Tax=Photobacterium arenosum TaxID=2774143 RepID=A0ABR9BF55_9GAMM|nr:MULTISPECIES: calcium/sodium antiporter [Photobacterium]MBD8511180.1 calcium/sodium antiporter [Photobacterium arenosum]MBV7263179.1 calcium/sodium antiporter [Photobacterium sp. WH24]